MQIRIEQTTQKKQKPNPDALGFGRHFTDHMFIMDYQEADGWQDPRIVPYQPLSLDPATAVFHYGQAVFEGLKAYRCTDGRILMFRPHQNMERMNVTNDRMCIPAVDPDFCVKAMQRLVEIDRDWVPATPGTSLYVRPFIVAVDPFLGVRPSRTYKYMIILSPVGAYYPQGINPVRIHVETHFVRAFLGGTGHVKAAGNYAASLKAQQLAEEAGYVQVLWLDAAEREFVEEVGSMNVFFKIGGEIITPALNGSILAGITRDSVVRLLRDWGLRVTQRRISMDEIDQAHQNGELEEAFGTGTAAVISPIGELNWNGKAIAIASGRTGETARRLYDELVGIQTGAVVDPYGWTVEVG